MRAAAAGDRLKVHRTLDGAKRYRLHRLDGDAGIAEIAGARRR